MNTQKANEASRKSFPIFALAALILTILKLGVVGGFATVSWWAIAAVLFFPFLLVIAFLAVVAVFAGVIGLLALIFGSRR